MTGLLIFVGFLAAMVVGGFIVSRITGARSHFLDEWALAPDEKILWRDDAADLAIITEVAQAKYMGAPRLHRWPAMATTHRIVIANKSVRGRPVVKYVLLREGRSPDPAEAAAIERLDGGLFKLGYSCIAIAPETGREDGYVVFTPLRGHASSTNLSRLQLYSDQAVAFPG